MDDLLFGKLLFPELDTATSTSEILKISNRHWFWDDYRATRMLPLMTKDAISGADGSLNDRGGEFKWIDYTPEVIKNWFEDFIFPWMGQKTRIMALMTKPNSKNNEHIDCDEKDLGTQQHKFRIVIHGKTETLYFKTDSGDIAAPSINGPFLMDGSWPHGMHNNDIDFKLTIAAGAPWNGNATYNNLEVLMKKSNHKFPEVYRDYLKKK